MARVKLTPEQIQARAAARIAGITGAMATELPRLGREMGDSILESVPELHGDNAIMDLLTASTESNVETFLHVMLHDIPISEVRLPAAATEYSRRLAQRGVPVNALLRAYRIGHHLMLEWALAAVTAEEPDREVALAAVQAVQTATFEYVDRVTEQVVVEYEAERERWLAHRTSVRTATLSDLLAGTVRDLDAAETTLNYRLRRSHIGVVAWTTETHAAPSELRRLEALVAAAGDALGATGAPLIVPQDSGLVRAWIPLDTPGEHRFDLDLLRRLTRNAGPDIRIALGRPRSGAAGFRTTHQESLRAHTVASIAGDIRVTAFAEPGVQICSILARDVDSTRKLVATTLGGLARDDEATAQLRATMLVFLQANSSYVATAELMHLHRNTVKYRIDKAVEARGTPLDEDRLDLELALTACRWLGRAILPTAPA